MASTSSCLSQETAAPSLKDEDAERPPHITCDFALPHCDHSAMFDDVYLRCFPHCCPHHRERSYCGSSIYVVVRSTSLPTRDRLVVYGRFRPLHADPLPLGSRISIASVEASLQSKDPSTGQWIESKAMKTPDGSKTGSLLYEINPEGRWYYPWSGAATIGMRLIGHIFEAHVFRRVGVELVLVAVAKSTTFRLMSFRRGSSSAFKEEAEASPPRIVLKKRKAITRAASPTDGLPRPRLIQETEDRGAAVSGGVLRFSIPNDAVASAPAVSAPECAPERLISRLPPLQSQLTLSPTQPPLYQSYQVAFPDVRLPPGHQLLDRSLRQEARLLAPPSAAPHVADNTLSTLLHWLKELPANSVGSRWMLAWERLVQEACEAHITAAHDHSSTRSDLVPILSALDGSVLLTSSSREFARAKTSPCDAIDSVVRLILHLWLDVGSTRASMKAIERVTRDGFRPNREALAHAHNSWLANVTARAQRFVREERLVDWSQLVSMSTSRSSDHATASGSDEFSFRAFAAQCRERYMCHHSRDSNAVRSCSRVVVPHKRQRAVNTPPSLHKSTRVWTTSMEDMSIEMDGMDPQALSLLTVVQFWKHLSCLRLDFSSGSHSVAAQLSVASVFNSLITGGSFTKLTLDGQYRWFNCLPSGESTVGTTLMGYVVGDYVGRATSAGTIHITTYLWPSGESSGTATAFAWHWTIDAASLTSGSSNVTSVVVECASVTSAPHPMETMSMAEKLRCVGRWHHACELRLPYKC